MGGRQATPQRDRIGRVIRDLHLPLSNLEYTIEQYLLSRGVRLDAETRLLLAGVRDCVGHVANSALDLSRQSCDALDLSRHSGDALGLSRQGGGTPDVSRQSGGTPDVSRQSGDGADPAAPGADPLPGRIRAA